MPGEERVAGEPDASGRAAAPVPCPLLGRRVWVAGHTGMVGSALARRLGPEGCDILTVSRAELDLRRQADVESWIKTAKPDVVFLAAATVGGIRANMTRPAEFLYDNLAIELNVIEAARATGVARLLFLGSACMYPRLAAQPIREDALLTGPFEPTSEAYAVAKIAGLKLCESYRRQYGCDFVSVVPTNVYGPGDNFDPESSHVAAALIAKICAAKANGAAEVEVWGTGRPRRGFVYVDDLADALVFLIQRYSDTPPVNVGSGSDISVGELAETIAGLVGFTGAFKYDRTGPDGAAAKAPRSLAAHRPGVDRENVAARWIDGNMRLASAERGCMTPAASN